jgi:hypothetical protein
MLDHSPDRKREDAQMTAIDPDQAVHQRHSDQLSQAAQTRQAAARTRKISRALHEADGHVAGATDLARLWDQLAAGQEDLAAQRQEAASDGYAARILLEQIRQDRREAAADRKAAAMDREEARDRDAAAADRRLSAIERAQRVPGGPDERTDDPPGRPVRSALVPRRTPGE